MAKQIFQRVRNEQVRLVTFSLADDVVSADFADVNFQHAIETNGIYTSKTGQLMMADGRKFYDALETAFANSSYIDVIETV